MLYVERLISYFESNYSLFKEICDTYLKRTSDDLQHTRDGRSQVLSVSRSGTISRHRHGGASEVRDHRFLLRLPSLIMLLCAIPRRTLSPISR